MKKLGMTGSELNDREEESPKNLLYDQSKESTIVGEKINNREMIRLLKK